jgi:hypothetical protein
MPFRNQYLAELTTLAVRDAEERPLPSPAVCAWFGKACLSPSVSLRLAESRQWRWVGVGGMQHILAESGAQVLVLVLALAQIQVR